MRFKSIGMVVIVLILIAAIGGGLYFWKNRKTEKVIPSAIEESKDSIFIHAAKQFSFKIPEQYSVTEPASGKQTFVYPTGKKIGTDTVDKIIGQDVIIIEIAVNKKDSFEAMVNEIKTAAEKDGNTVKVEPKEFDKLKATTLTVNGKTNYQQTLFNTSTIIALTYRTGLPAASEVEQSLSIDQSLYSERIAIATNLMKETKGSIATAQFEKLYQSSSEGLKKLKSQEEFSKILDDINEEFNKNVLIWGISLTSNGVGTAINIIDQDKVVRRGSFSYIKESDKYVLDGLRISGEITPAKDSKK